eukprot:jgi/Mesen1/7477/ME000039S06692
MRLLLHLLLRLCWLAPVQTAAQAKGTTTDGAQGGQEEGQGGAGGKEGGDGGGEGEGEEAEESESVKRQRTSRTRREVSVALTLTGPVDLTPLVELGSTPVPTPPMQEAMRVCSVVLKDYAARRHVVHKDSFFSPSFGIPRDLGGGAEMWSGYALRPRPAAGKLCANLDVVSAAMTKAMPVRDYLTEVLNMRPQEPLTSLTDAIRAKSFLRGLVVKVTHTVGGHRRAKVKGLTREPCSRLRFPLTRFDAATGADATEEVGVVQYYREAYNVELQYPNLPCIDCGSPTKITWYPMELCQIVEGQKFPKSISDRQLATMGRSRLTPEQRLHEIRSAVERNQLDNDPYLGGFGISIGRNLLEVDARKLESPKLQFGPHGQFRVVTPQANQARWQVTRSTFFKPAVIPSWAVVSFDAQVPEERAGYLATKLADVCRQRGMTVPEPLVVLARHPTREPLRDVEAVVEELRQGRPTFVLFFLRERKTSAHYAPIKRLFDTGVGFPTQVISTADVSQERRLGDQFYNNVALKINMKMGGNHRPDFVNWTLGAGDLPKVHDLPTVVFGIDVTHPGPGSHAPSVAAVVASMDQTASRYSCRVRSQPTREQSVLGLCDSEDGATHGMVRELLTDFYDKNRLMPARIIIYRAGLSEHQFVPAGLKELNDFRKVMAPNALLKNTKITLVTVQKRHNTRLFPAHGHGNVDPGTVVDEGLCNPNTFDFFLCSQRGSIGTSRPAHYHVLHDENGFTADDIQKLTHSLCYNGARILRPPGSRALPQVHRMQRWH